MRIRSAALLLFSATLACARLPHPSIGSQTISGCDRARTGADVRVIVSDTEGAALSEATVSLAAGDGGTIKVTDTHGHALFAGLASGPGYRVTAVLAGFTTVVSRKLKTQDGCLTEVRLQMTFDPAQTDGPLMVEPAELPAKKQ